MPKLQDPLSTANSCLKLKTTTIDIAERGLHLFKMQTSFMTHLYYSTKCEMLSGWIGMMAKYYFTLTFNALNELRTAMIVTPTSPNMAAQRFVIPKALKININILTPIANTIF